MKTAIITWTSFQDQEVVYPYYFLRGKYGEDNCKIFSNVTGRFHGIMGVNMTSHGVLADLVAKPVDSFRLVVLPGGVKALEKLRQEKSVISWLRQYSDHGGVIASTCHGAQLLISAGLTKGKKVSGYYSIEDDIRNSGGMYSREPVVIDQNIVSSPHYDFMGEWMNAAVALAEERNAES